MKTHPLPSKALGVLIALLAILAPATVSAVTLLDDTFASGTNPGWSSLDGLSGVTLSVVSDGALGGNALEFSASSNNRGTQRSLSQSVTLGVGDSITLGFAYRFSTLAPDSNFGFDFGLFNSADADNGFEVQTNPGADTANGGRLRTFPGSTGTNVGTTFATFNGGTLPQSVEFTLTRSAADEMTLRVQWNESATFDFTRTASATTFFTFDTVEIRLNGSSAGQGPFLVDSVLVTTTVPEPSAAALLPALFLAGAWWALRRQPPRPNAF